MLSYSSNLAAVIVLTTALFTSSVALSCTSERGVAICLEYLNPYSDNAYFWTSILGKYAPSDTSVLTGGDGEFWDSIDGW